MVKGCCRLCCSWRWCWCSCGYPRRYVADQLCAIPWQLGSLPAAASGSQPSAPSCSVSANCTQLVHLASHALCLQGTRAMNSKQQRLAPASASSPVPTNSVPCVLCCCLCAAAWSGWGSAQQSTCWRGHLRLVAKQRQPVRAHNRQGHPQHQRMRSMGAGEQGRAMLLPCLHSRRTAAGTDWLQLCPGSAMCQDGAAGCDHNHSQQRAAVTGARTYCEVVLLLYGGAMPRRMLVTVHSLCCSMRRREAGA